MNRERGRIRAGVRRTGSGTTTLPGPRAGVDYLRGKRRRHERARNPYGGRRRVPLPPRT
ncbi:hypothetical protein GCM10009837_21640 [Streptomyces durmitorensis]